MRRIGRWMLNALTALSLLVCVAAVVLWVRSVSHVDHFSSRHKLSAISLQSYRQQLLLIFAERRPPPASLHDENGEMATDADMVQDDLRMASGIDIRIDGWGFAIWRMVKEDPNWVAANFPTLTRFDTLIVPHWFVVLLTALLPGIKVWSFLRKRRGNVVGGCRLCGYDLTGNLSGVCPECGTSVCKT